MTKATCGCGAEYDADEPRVAHGLETLAIYQSDGTMLETEPCLTAACRWVAAAAWYSDFGARPKIFIFIFHGGQRVNRSVWLPIYQAAEREMDEDRKRDQAEAAMKPAHRITLRHHEFPDEPIDCGASRTSLEWWKNEFEPFGFEVEAKKVR